jgi:hypothetical protein
MALQPCAECGAQISNQATACPQCGMRVKRQWSLWLKLLLAFFAAFLLFKIFTPSANPNVDRPGTAAQPDRRNFHEGPAPAGDPIQVADRVIKKRSPACQKVTEASRVDDGRIVATCSGEIYLVFTLQEKPGAEFEAMAFNCTAAKRELNVSCFKS